MRRPPLHRGDLREVAREVRDNELLTFASAIAFQTLTAIVPAIATLLALLGALQLTELWEDAARELRDGMSPAAYVVLDDAVRKILEERQLFWLTIGLALALWSLSGAVRAMMGALDRVYGAEEERPLPSLVWTSVGLAAAIAVLLVGAIASVRVVPLVVEADGVAGAALGVARWTLAAVLVALAVALTLRHGARAPQPLPWLGVGTSLVVVTWLALSALFGIYVTKVADYGSLFGSLAVVWVLTLYLYLSGIAFVSGIQLDALLRSRMEGSTA